MKLPGCIAIWNAISIDIVCYFSFSHSGILNLRALSFCALSLSVGTSAQVRTSNMNEWCRNASSLSVTTIRNRWCILVCISRARVENSCVKQFTHTNTHKMMKSNTLMRQRRRVDIWAVEKNKPFAQTYTLCDIRTIQEVLSLSLSHHHHQHHRYSHPVKLVLDYFLLIFHKNDVIFEFNTLSFSVIVAHHLTLPPSLYVYGAYLLGNSFLHRSMAYAHS